MTLLEIKSSAESLSSKEGKLIAALCEVIGRIHADAKSQDDRDFGKEVLNRRIKS